MREGLLELRKFASFCRMNNKEAGLYFDNEFIELEGEPITLLHSDFENRVKAFDGPREVMNWLKEKYPELYKLFKERRTEQMDDLEYEYHKENNLILVVLLFLTAINTIILLLK